MISVGHKVWGSEVGWSCGWGDDSASNTRTCASILEGAGWVASETEVILTEMNNDGSSGNRVSSPKSSEWIVVVESGRGRMLSDEKLLEITNVSDWGIPGGVVHSSWVEVTSSSSTAGVKSSIGVHMESVESFSKVLHVSLHIGLTNIGVAWAVVT